MKKTLILILPLVLITLVFIFLVLFLDRDTGRGALQVTSVPKSQVILDEKYIGDTPLCLCKLGEMILSGSHTVKLIPQGSEFSPLEEKIKINSSVLTVVDRTFGRGTTSAGSTITLNKLSDEKAVEMMVISFPNDAEIIIDNNPGSKTPYLFKNLTPSDHEVKLTKDGFKDKTLKIRTVAGYRLEAIVYMGVNESLEKTASASASNEEESVTILSTPTGFLRVRVDSTVDSEEVGRVNPGEVFTLVAEKEDWYQIKLPNGRSGWISSSYATKN